MYMEFDPVSTKISHVAVNISAASEHVGYINIEIRVLKNVEKLC